MADQQLIIAALAWGYAAETAANMASFGTRHVINPFEKSGEYLALAVRSPGAWHLLTWLTGQPGTTVKRLPPPRARRADPVRARSELALTLSNENALSYVLTGRNTHGGRLWQKHARGTASDARAG